MKYLIFAVSIIISGAAYAATTAPTTCASGTKKVSLPFVVWRGYEYGATSCPDGYQTVIFNENYGKILGIDSGTDYSDGIGVFTVADFCPLTE